MAASALSARQITPLQAFAVRLLVWSLFESVRHVRVSVRVFGVPVRIAVAKLAPVIALLVGERPAVVTDDRAEGAVLIAGIALPVRPDSHPSGADGDQVPVAPI